MTDYILISINYSNLSHIKVFSRNAVVCMFDKNKSLHNIAHFYISVYPKTCLSYFICKTVHEKNIAYLNPKFTNYFNFLQFFIVYPGISNPGPAIQNSKKYLSVFYQNVQGLIPFGSLADQHPNLEIAKISELQAYMFKKNPDIVILNETWLKPIILSSEIFPNKYVFRLDRSPHHTQPTPLTQKSLGKMVGAC